MRKRQAEEPEEHPRRNAAKAGKTIGKESQKVWYRGVEVSKPALERARAETRRALQRTLDAMDRSIVSLKLELHRLNGESDSRVRSERGIWIIDNADLFTNPKISNSGLWNGVVAPPTGR